MKIPPSMAKDFLHWGGGCQNAVYQAHKMTQRFEPLIAAAKDLPTIIFSIKKNKKLNIQQDKQLVLKIFQTDPSRPRPQV